ncbi:MAG: hypothetical protein U1F52_02570 [Burkholderiales bacterium]
MARSDRLGTFVAPRPCPALIRALVPLNRWVCLHGVPGLRSVPWLNAIPGIRGVTDVTAIDLPAADAARLREALGPGRATFLAPNHPEFFTDWMLDKELSARFAPLMASWATHDIVNGMGPLMQRFWLANNLIAQIPGAGGADGKAHSVRWARAGHGVLLHPEGQVAWTADRIQPLFPGVVEMACAAAGASPEQRACIAPILWHLRFLSDVDAALHRTLDYVDGRLDLRTRRADADAAQRLHDAYLGMLARDERAAGIAVTGDDEYAHRWERAVATFTERIRGLLDDETAQPPGGSEEAKRVVRNAERALRRDQEDGRGARHIELREATQRLRRLLRFDPAWYPAETLTQEQVAENLQRLRIDYCRGTWRDTVHRFVPRPVGPRIARIRIPPPIDIESDESPADGQPARQLLSRLQDQMQATLDALVAEGERVDPTRRYPNPFRRTS